MALFEVRVAGLGPNTSVILPSGAQARGMFWSVDLSANSSKGTDANSQITAKLAAVTDEELIGFNGRAITTTGLRTDAQILWDEGWEGADKAGGYASISPLPEMFEVETDDTNAYFDASAPPTAIADLCNFKAGKVQKAQAGELAWYQVVGINTGTDDATKTRFTLKKLPASQIIPAG